ncbi:recombinase family protein [Anaerotruncus rubiinfantis]|uniref:recombinase family protein n=1 Tax=Anaerotruncus rubiinfantis TaxID=1720200 RepID=UPI00083647BD|nr:recombinase family protein [Anaerotruncus rubiinfantis]
MSEQQREIIVIPATEGKGNLKNKHRQLRVASYSRVSTDFEEQLTSFHAQKSYYTDLILRTPEWTLAGTYADEGISGASAEKRPDFMRMYRHCKKGKIDLIITKSISRFARNTLDSIGYVRKLKAMGVGVLFEKENINTLEENSEVVLTILASLAQEELNSMSMNIKMGKRMAMQEGKIHFPYSKVYAYRKGGNGQPEIIPEEAEIVKRIYKSYLAGESVGRIMDALNREGIPSPSKKGQWTDTSIRGLLRNERYCGDVLLQKTYITDPISKKSKKNNGELPKIYIKNNHVPIVSREIFEQVQRESARRVSKRKVTKASVTEQGRYSSLYALNDILICGECGSPYKRVTWTKRSGEKQIVWRCYKRLDYGTKYCKDSVTLDEESLHTAIMEAISATAGERQSLIPLVMEQLEHAMWESVDGQINVEQMEQRMAELKEQTLAMINQSIDSHTVGENESSFKAMSDELRALHDMLTEYKAASGTQVSIEQKISDCAEFLEQEPIDYNTYNDALVRQLIDTIKVKNENALMIYFKSGLEYEQPIQPKVRKLKAS